eukprot:6948837-Pyramimonas_sp.AAC.1
MSWSTSLLPAPRPELSCAVYARCARVRRAPRNACESRRAIANMSLIMLLEALSSANYRWRR